MASQEKCVISREQAVSMAFTSIAAGLLFVSLNGTSNDPQSWAYRVLGLVFILFSLFLIFVSINGGWLTVKCIQQIILLGSPSVQVVTIALLFVRLLETFGKISQFEWLFIVIYFSTLVFILLYLISCGIPIFRKKK